MRRFYCRTHRVNILGRGAKMAHLMHWKRQGVHCVIVDA